MRSSITILVVALLAACGSNDSRTSGPALTFEPTPSEPGEEVSLQLRNTTQSEVTYNLCASALSHQRAGRWVPVSSGRGCPSERQTLEPGAEDSYDYELPATLDGGSYRFSTRVEVGGTRIEEIYSPTFRMPEPTPADTAEVEAETPAS